MSLDATRWAWLQDVRPCQKLVLLSLADRADEHHRCYPSIRRLESDTGLDRKTIMSAIKEMESAGLLVTHRQTGAVNEYQLMDVHCRADIYSQSQKRDQSQKRTSTKNGTAPVPETGQDQYQKRDTESTNNLPRTKERGKTQKRKRFVRPSLREVEQYIREIGGSTDAQQWMDFYESKGWKVGKTPMKDWKACVRTWERRHEADQRDRYDTDYQRGMRKLEQQIAESGEGVAKAGADVRGKVLQGGWTRT